MKDSRGGPTTFTTRFTWVFVGAACLATLGKFLLAANDVYWSDEMASLFYAKQPGWSALLWDNSPPLFYIFLKFWLHFARSEFAVKILPVLFSICTPWVLFFCARRFWNKSIANFALIASSFHPVSFYYATEVRTYSLAELVGAVQLYFFFESRERGRPTFGYHVASILLICSHYMGVIFVLAQFPTLFFARLPKDRAKLWPLSRGQLLLLFEAFLLAAVTFEVARHISFHDIEFLRITGPTAIAMSPAVLFYDLCAHSAVGAAILIGFFVWSRRSLRPLGEVLILCLMSVPVIALLTGFAPTPERYYIFLVPTICLAFAIGIEQFAYRFLKNAVLASCALAFLFLGVRHYTQNISRAGWKEASQKIAARETNLVVLFGHQSLKDPYFSLHRTVAVPRENAPDFLRGDDSKHDIWLVFPEANREISVIAQVQNYLADHNYGVAQWGVFSPSASQPVGYIKYSKLGAD